MDEPASTTDKSRKINAINKETIHHICSGQVVLDLATAVKELLENSLDSGATIIDIRLTDHGRNCISVSDNGSGVLEEDFEGLGLKHHTSKLREFSDLTGVSTFGFRGEALSSLCSLSELSVVTKHDTGEHGFRLEFDRNGILVKKEACARERGTTVQARNIFKSLPVRAKEFQRNIKKEYARAIQVLYSYCLVSTHTKITCSNSVSGKPSSLVVSTIGSGDVLTNVNSLFGKKSLEGLCKLELLPPDEETLREYNLPEGLSVDFDWDCYVSSCDHDFGRSMPDRQFLYVNGRPCDLAKVSKLINNVYHKYNAKQYPFVFLNLKLQRDCADINVTPDKRTIFCSQERLILATLKFSLTTKWEKLQCALSTRSLADFNIGAKRAKSPNLDGPPAKKLQYLPRTCNTSQTADRTRVTSDTQACQKAGERIRERLAQATGETLDQEVGGPVIEDGRVLLVLNDAAECPVDYERPSCTMRISIATIRNALTKSTEDARERSSARSKRVRYRARIAMDQNVDAETELKRELTKESFVQMEILGQFNLGFVIARLDDDLFIIDQHATDEKFRFERLNNETRLKTQKLIAPKQLNLSTLNETTVMDHLGVFENNGFEFNVKPEAECGHRIQLTGMPVSGNWQFGQEDIEELVFLIREGSGENSDKGNILRPSRVRQMLASRACRGAVMIGTALSVTEMQKLVRQMSLMQQPWNCPHGRPTIRHLLSLSLLSNKQT